MLLVRWFDTSVLARAAGDYSRGPILISSVEQSAAIIVAGFMPGPLKLPIQSRVASEPTAVDAAEALVPDPSLVKASDCVNLLP